MRLLSLVIAVVSCAASFGQDCGAAPSPGSGPQPLTRTAKPATFQSFPATQFVPAPSATRSTQEELDFLANGPKLFPMDKALQVAKLTGKGVVCWMGPHIFADARARAASLALGDTTIQATMDTDGETVAANGKPLPVHRVKFSSNNYEGNKQTAFIPVSKLDNEAPAKILAFVRGASRR